MAWLCFLAGAAVVRLLDVSFDGVPGQAVTLTLIAVALGVTGWLEDGGFERLGADPDNCPRFAWLAIFFSRWRRVAVQCLALWIGLETVQNDREPSPG